MNIDQQILFAIVAFSIIMLSIISLKLNMKQSKKIELIDNLLCKNQLATSNLESRLNSLTNSLTELKNLLESPVIDEPTQVDWGAITEVMQSKDTGVKTKKQASEDTRKIAEKYPHYFMNVEGYDFIDVYRILDDLGPSDAALQHAIKKLMACGNRGSKNFRKDLKEVIDTLNRRMQMLDEDGME